MFKKLTALIFTLFCLSAITVSAKSALYSDIDTYINHYPINAYSVDGKMVVVAEDLRDYGFNVEWRENTRSLHISRNTGVKKLYKKDVYDPQCASGTKYMDIYNSDIKVYYNNTKLESFSLNGRTLIAINDLASLVGHGDWLANIRAYKVWVDGLSVCDYEPLKKRCINFWYDGTDEKTMPTVRFTEDMDSDGIKEDVKVSIDRKDSDGFIGLSMTIGGQKHIVTTGGWVYNVQAVYLTDFVPNDNAKEIALFLSCESGDPVITILKYKNKKIENIPFRTYSVHNQDYYVTDYLDGTYTPVFKMNDDGSVTLRQGTFAVGMWDIYATYKMNYLGQMELIPQTEYEIIPGWDSYFADKYGYHIVNRNYTGYGMPLYKGDKIKAIANDLQGRILIQKSNGTKGWVTRNSYDLYDVSTLFFMAG